TTKCGPVIPAQAGIYSTTSWIPACAGMTSSLLPFYFLNVHNAAAESVFGLKPGLPGADF
ncbi:MAG: hypothetical protein DWQ04_15620, partial [Chloroflexi bacterium]